MRHLLYLLTGIVLHVSLHSRGQDFTYPSIKKTGSRITDFIPSKWTIRDSTSGDLNKDGINDVVIVLQHKDNIKLTNADGDEVTAKPRSLIVLFKDAPTNTFQLADQSNTLIPMNDNPAYIDDPYQGMAIDKNILHIELQLSYGIGSWYRTDYSYAFRYQKESFVLIGANYSSTHRATLDYKSYSYNFLTKKRSLTKGNDNTNKKRTTWKSIPITTLKILTTFTPFHWGVEKNVYL